MNEHTKSLLQALVDGKQLERLDNDGKWMTIAGQPYYALQNLSHRNLRVKQPTIRIGEVDVPEPLRVAPENGAYYWLAHLTHDATCYKNSWSGSPGDCRWLKSGFVHLTQEAAIAHAKALIAVSGGTV